MAVNQKQLLADCQRQLKLIEADLKEQATALPTLDASLRAEYEAAREAKRVGDAFEIWRGEQATQAAVHWGARYGVRALPRGQWAHRPGTRR